MKSAPHASSTRLSSAECMRWCHRIHAFAGETLLHSASESDGAGELGGMAVGVKDIIDVAGFPTRNGSDTCRDIAAAERDAEVVAALRSAGATIVGKTVTTEFAFTDPTNCRNPYDLNRSPGGSSSGSGAAVAAGIVDIALGTQTAGSLCRPAAYCGTVGFKPSYGVLSTKGVTPLAPSFDTVGIIARNVKLSERAFNVMRPTGSTDPASDKGTSVIGKVLLDQKTSIASETMAAFHEASEALQRLYAETRTPVLPVDVAAVVADHRIVMNREAFDAHGHLLAEDQAHLLKPKFRAGLEAGAGISGAQKRSAHQRLVDAREIFWESMEGVHAILTLPVPDGAPLLDGTTGFQDWLTPWTVFGGPLICLPWGLDGLGRPRAIMLAGRPGSDANLLSIASRLEDDAPDLPSPALPD